MRDRERDRERERDRDRERARETERETVRDRERERDRARNGEREGERETHRDRETERDRVSERVSKRERERERQRDRERETATERERDDTPMQVIITGFPSSNHSSGLRSWPVRRCRPGINYVHLYGCSIYPSSMRATGCCCNTRLQWPRAHGLNYSTLILSACGGRKQTPVRHKPDANSTFKRAFLSIDLKSEQCVPEQPSLTPYRAHAHRRY